MEELGFIIDDYVQQYGFTTNSEGAQVVNKTSTNTENWLLNQISKNSTNGYDTSSDDSEGAAPFRF